MTGLTDLERAVLDFAPDWWKYETEHGKPAGAGFDLTPAEYDHILIGLADRQDAADYAPHTVAWLRRVQLRRETDAALQGITVDELMAGYYADRETLDGGPPCLSDRERDILDFAGTWWHSTGLKEQAIRSRFGISATRYAQVLNALIDRPEAVEYSPLTVRRLQRIRDKQRQARSRARLRPV